MKPLLLLGLLFAQPATAQMYADFTINDGTSIPKFFTICLNFESPNDPRRAVSNFIGLASGSRKWVDEATGETKIDTPFYDGLLIHKVVSDLIPPIHSGIYFGSPDGSGNDGPGYTYQDEPNPSSGGPNTVYLDSSAPNSNGSRIFITSSINQSVDLTPIGYVVNIQSESGQLSTTNIFNFTTEPTDSNGKPDFPLTITEVSIRRMGNPADLFNENNPNWQLPEVGISVPEIVVENDTHFLRFSSAPGTAGIYYRSPDLTTWDGPITVFQSPDDPELGVDLTSLMAVNPKQFFRGSSIYYPTTPAADKSLPNAAYRTFLTSATLGSRIYDFIFNETGDGGTWCWGFNGNCYQSGNLTLVDFKIEGPYTSSLFVSGDNGLPDLFFRFHHDRDTPTGQPLVQSRLEGSQWEDHPSLPFRVVTANSTFLPTANNVWQYFPAP